MAVLHDGNAIGYLADDGEVVGDEEHGERVGAAEAGEKIEDLGLDGDVERGGGLVGDEEAGSVDDGHGDEDALALAAGELVGEVCEAAFGVGKGDLVEGLEDAVADLGPAERGVMGLDGFGDLSADGHDGVEGGHGLLKDHGDLPAALAAELGVGEGAEVLTGEEDLPGDAGGGGKKAEQGERGGGLAGAGLADEAEGLAGVDAEADVADGGMGRRSEWKGRRPGGGWRARVSC